MSNVIPPPSTSLTLHALLTLPIRICNPPPAASRVRSCKVTPLIKVTLDDVLNKRHLPPLTLKDFEEWLVFVEGNPQYLYFILWLKEYESRYAAWLAESGCALPSGCTNKFASTTTLGADLDPDTPCSPRGGGRDFSYTNLIPSSAPLALFFTRAKQTFLDPASNSPYALGHAALLALAPSTHSLTPSIPQFTVPLDDNDGPGRGLGSLPVALATQPHPHPKELAPLAIYARKVLKQSLERFAETACHNVGSRRAWCGIAGGTLITLVMGILPALAAFFFATSRWWRTVGWFGCWLGGTIVISSLHGICMMIYIFGDLRQLRSFELARPSISEPRAIARARPRLKSFFTREPSDSHSGMGAGTGPIPPPKPAVVASVPLGTDRNKTGKARGKRPWSASASETSTGTPVVHFGPGAFRLGVGTGTTESELEVEEMVVGAGSSGGTALEHDDFGIEISPAYYYSGQGGEREGERAEHRESVRSGASGVGNKIGLVMRWVLGRRGSVGVGTGRGEKVMSICDEKAPQVQTRSHAGTFGIRSWRGGLGSLPEHSDDIVSDLERGDYDAGGGGLGDVADDEECLEDSGPVDTDASADAEVTLDNMLTAEFITRDYPDPVLHAPDLDPKPAAVLEEGTIEENTVTLKQTTKRVSFPVSPVQFDFDKLPAVVAAARRMSSPSSFAPAAFPMSPHSSFTHVLSSSQLLSGSSLSHSPPPCPPLAVVSPAHAPAPIEAEVKAMPVAKARQWWDTCPRHPAVEATLAPQARAPPLVIQTHGLPRPASLLPGARTRNCIASSLMPPLLDADPGSCGSTRATSPASSDIHSRVRVNMMVSPASTTTTTASTASPKSKFNFKTQFRVKAVTSPGLKGEAASWRTRFRRVTAVPAFGPLTRVLEPVVSRGQWEIVVRSAVVAAVGAWIVIGSLVALPVIR